MAPSPPKIRCRFYIFGTLNQNVSDNQGDTPPKNERQQKK